MTNIFSNFSNPRVITALIFDMIVALISFWLALYLRFETLNVPLVQDLSFNRFFFISMFIHLICFVFGGLYKGVWRFSSMHDLIRVVRASMSSVVLSLVVCFYMTRLDSVPRSMFPIQLVLLIVGLGGGRFAYRFLKDQTSFRKVLGGHDSDLKNVIIVGAGRAGEKLLRDILSTPALKLKVVAFVDDEKFKKNVLIHNVKVHGDPSLIPSISRQFNVEKIFIAIPSASGDDIKRIIKYCDETKAEIKILPKMDHLLSAKVELSLLQNLKIEDLLGREQIKLDMKNLTSMIENKVILVTGAGGSIGSELCIQIAKFSPKLLIMADYCELFMYELEMKFKEQYPNIAYYPKILDVRNFEKVENTFREFLPQVIFHAAAYKHVPMMEYNPLEAIETNVQGSKIVANMALKYEAERFVMISTDKAVNPTNVMGASKRIAEMVITDISNYAKANGNKTKFMSVRFGNVLGSNGSVIPLFRRQIEERKDITVTHPDIIRYFMSIPEACQLVLQAGSMGDGGEIFVLDMGEPVKIVDLAKQMIKIAGLEEGRDIKIVFSGLRPGEKLYEELFADSEAHEHTIHGKIRKAKFRELTLDFESNLERLLTLKNVEPETVVYVVKELVPEFSHFRLKTFQQDEEKRV
jgi:FlaA1/EpsC-like NDP-sugar epimerase